MTEKYKNVYGTWEVRTENDVEAKTTEYLGTFTGYVDEIALYLVDECYYSLTFKKVKSIEKYPQAGNQVNVQFDIESETWNNIKSPEGLIDIKYAFIDRPVEIHESNYHGSFLIKKRYNQNLLK